MKKIISLIIFLLACTLLVGCDILYDIVIGHSCVYTEWETVEEATCIEAGEEERYCVICYETQTRPLAKLSHSPIEYEGLEATCTEEGKTEGSYCEICNLILSGIESIPATGHNVVVDPPIDATDSSPGRTEGSHCSICQEVIVKQMSVFSGEYSNPEKYHGNYAYNSLDSFANGSAMQSFYEEIDAIALEFHTSLIDAKTKINQENTIYYAAEIVYSDNGVTDEQALTVWNAYIKDHPLYYWLSNRITYTADYITLMVDEEYIDGEVREAINAEIYKTVEEYVLALNGVGDVYQITLAFHDRIIDNADYAYEPDGVTPSNENPHHNIIGVLIDGLGVCESYTKTFQLLLNYCNVENVYVSGYAGEAHAWNLVQLDDGEWYWYDLTWDDQPNMPLGVRYNYFCVTDNTLVDWIDGSASKSTAFLSSTDHIPDSPGGVGTNYRYPLPERSDTEFDYDGLMIRDEIIVKDGLYYVLSGFMSVSLIKIEAEGDIVIPESISHGGNSLKVECIGSYDEENRIFLSSSVIEYDSVTYEHLDVTSVYIPSGVRYIWDFAFDHCYTIESFNVSADNKVFTSQSGILFTKSLYTLIKYPLASGTYNYTVPSETVEIAYGAFGDGGNLFCPQNLTRLTIGPTVAVIGAVNGGVGYRDSLPKNPADVTMIDGYVDRLYNMLSNGLYIN